MVKVTNAFCAKFGLPHFCWLCINPKESEDVKLAEVKKGNKTAKYLVGTKKVTGTFCRSASVWARASQPRLAFFAPQRWMCNACAKSTASAGLITCETSLFLFIFSSRL